MNIKSIQLYNSLHPQVSASQYPTYQDYLDGLFAELRSQRSSIRQLIAANRELPPWVGDRQSLVWVRDPAVKRRGFLTVGQQYPALKGRGLR